MPKVTPIEGEIMRFRVESDSGEKDYFVDLSEYDGAGFCDCPHFAMRIMKERREGKTTYCKHLKRTFTYFGWQQARAIAAEMKRNENKRR